MKNSENGFSIVEALIAIALVGLIGTSGWLVLNRQKYSSGDGLASTGASEQVAAKPEPPIEEYDASYAGWKTYQSTFKSNLSFRYPADWVFEPPIEEFKNVDGREHAGVILYSTEPKRDPGGIGGPNPASNVYMSVTIDEYRGPWHHSDWRLGAPISAEAFKVNNNTELTVLTFEGDKPMMGRLVLFKDGKKEVSTRNGYIVVAHARFNYGQGDDKILESMTEDFGEREETKTASKIIKSIRY